MKKTLLLVSLIVIGISQSYSQDISPLDADTKLPSSVRYSFKKTFGVDATNCLFWYREGDIYEANTLFASNVQLFSIQSSDGSILGNFLEHQFYKSTRDKVLINVDENVLNNIETYINSIGLEIKTFYIVYQGNELTYRVLDELPGFEKGWRFTFSSTGELIEKTNFSGKVFDDVFLKGVYKSNY